jgi:hypothetical protein
VTSFSGGAAFAGGRAITPQTLAELGGWIAERLGAPSAPAR